MKNIFFMALLCLFIVQSAKSQTQQHQSGWFMLLNSTKISNKWGLHFDAQLRTNDNWEHLRNTLVRPGITYYFNNKTNATVGYLWNTTQSKSLTGPTHILDEHRVWEQVLFTHKLGSSASLSHRFRLEQRFIQKKEAKDVFAQRFRYFARAVQPFKNKATGFKEGMFVALQNEVFLNVQNKSSVNNSLFDQNRAYLALGYRFSPKMDIEAGYLNQYTKGATANTMNNALQLALYTRF